MPGLSQHKTVDCYVRFDSRSVLFPDQAGKTGTEQKCRSLTGNIFTIEPQGSSQQETKDIHAAAAGIMQRSPPGNLWFEYIAPVIHISRKEIRSQILKE